MKNAIILVLLFFSLNALGQEEHLGHEKHEPFKHQRMALVWSHTHIPAYSEGDLKNKEIYLPSIGLDYQFWFNHKVAIGWFNDLEMASYLVTENGEEKVEREFPFVSTIVFSYKVWKELSLYGGPGIELEHEENFFIVKLGLEYEIEFKYGWDLSPTFNYDLKEGHFGAWSLGVGIGKRF